MRGRAGPKKGALNNSIIKLAYSTDCDFTFFFLPLKGGPIRTAPSKQKITGHFETSKKAGARLDPVSNRRLGGKDAEDGPGAGAAAVLRREIGAFRGPVVWMGKRLVWLFGCLVVLAVGYFVA